MLDDRKLKVLKAIIENYTLDAQPVGSKTILDKLDLGVSSATIRNDMSVLEEMGLVEKTHSSSGRVPSNKAYRYYVKKLLEDYEVGRVRGDVIKPLNKEVMEDQGQEPIERSTRVLSEITKQTALALVSYDADPYIKGLNLSKIDKNLLLLTVVFNVHDIVNETFYTLSDVSYEDLFIANKLINQSQGLSLSDYIKLLEGDIEANPVLKEIMEKVTEILNKVLLERKKIDLVFNGLSNIFKHPEYQNTSKAKDFIDLIEDTDTIGKILVKDLGKDISVTIGEDKDGPSLSDVTIITRSFSQEGKDGIIGIIGPTRMDYGSVILSILSISTTLRTVENEP